MLCRAKSGALKEFASWEQRLSVPEAGWDSTQAKDELEAEIVGHTERLIASKVKNIASAQQFNNDRRHCGTCNDLRVTHS